MLLTLEDARGIQAFGMRRICQGYRVATVRCERDRRKISDELSLKKHMAYKLSDDIRRIRHVL